jgi:hypothetical protein
MSDREGMDLFQFKLGSGTNLQKGNAFSDNVRYSVIWAGWICTHLCMENVMTESMEEDKTTMFL